MKIGICIFIQAMCRNALGRAAQPGTKRTNDGMIAANLPENHTFTHVLGGHGPALRYLSGMPRQTFRKTAQNWHGSEQGRIATTSCQHKVGTRFNRALQWLHSHHADYPDTTIDDLLINMGRRMERADAIFTK